jgi:hypothetical protein
MDPGQWQRFCLGVRAEALRKDHLSERPCCPYAAYDRIPERHLLDIVVRIERLTGSDRHLGSLSGNEPKMDDAWERQALAIFAYGTRYVEFSLAVLARSPHNRHLGPHQMARHVRGTLDADHIASINRRHLTTEKLDAALRECHSLLSSIHPASLLGRGETGCR